MGALLMGDLQRAAIGALRELAASNPVDIQWLKNWIGDPDIKALHMERMTAQSIAIPTDFMVTYSIETGHPAGTCRHLSISVSREDRLPSPQAAWMIAEEFGFVGNLSQCAVWKEDLQGHGMAINVVQPLAVISK